MGGGGKCRQRAFMALNKEDRMKVLEILKKLDEVPRSRNSGRAMSEQLIRVYLTNKDDQKKVASSILPHTYMLTATMHEVQGYPDVDLLVSTCTLALRLRAKWDSSDEGKELCARKDALGASHAVFLNPEFCAPRKPTNPVQMDDGSVSAKAHSVADCGGSAGLGNTSATQGGAAEGGSAGPGNTSATQGGTAGQWVQQGPSASTFGNYHPLDLGKLVRVCLYCRAIQLHGQHKIGGRRCRQAWRKLGEPCKSESVSEPNYGSDEDKLVSSCSYCGYKGRGRYHQIGSRKCRAAAKAPASMFDSSGHSSYLHFLCEEQTSSMQALRRSQPDTTSILISSLPVFSSEDAQQAFLCCMGLRGPSSGSDRALLICGPPGTGKSFITQRLVLVLRIVLKSNTAVALTAPTGLLARDIGGVTLHSWAGIGLAKQLDPGVLYDEMSAAAKRRWNEAEVLILDDASLIAAELFDCLEVLARKVRSQPDIFFGGLFVVLQFDLEQLHPVKCRCDSCRGYFDQKCNNDDPHRTPLYNSVWWEGFLHEGENAPLCVFLSTQWRFGGCDALQCLIDSLRHHSSKTPMREEDHQLLEKDEFLCGPSAPSVPKPVVLCPVNAMVGPRIYASSLPLSLSHCCCHTLHPFT
jgi:hypothetical protein